MKQRPPGAAPHLVDSLARLARRHPVARKLLVAPNHAAGRELLRRLALEGDGWVGFEVLTPHRLAHRLATVRLEGAGLTVLDPFEALDLFDLALDTAIASYDGPFTELAEGVGFRERVQGAITALRLAGVDSAMLERTRFRHWERKRLLLRVLQRYERLLAERRRADGATVLSVALEALDEAGGQLPPSLGAEAVALVPGLGRRGLQGRLIGELEARGARLLATDPVVGMAPPEAVLWGRCGAPSTGSFLHAPEELPAEVSPPTTEFFAAASIEAELREVLRRVLQRGLTWDQVEIVTPDPAAYGSALHALASRLGIPVSYAVGLPVARTRTGRVVRAYLDWIEGGFPADTIRLLLEAGDLRPHPSRGRHAPAALARRFRSLRVGWGRRRYRTQLKAALEAVERLRPGGRERPDVFERRRDRHRSELEGLKSILFPALKATPTVPDRMGEGGASVSPAELARGLQAFLRRVPHGRGPDRTAREEVGRILERVQATRSRRTEFRSAVAILRRHLDIRVRTEIVGDDPDGPGAPWSSTGGAIHLSDVEHGGFTGRSAVFLVGLHADAIPGEATADPLLLDGDRRVLGRDLPTAAESQRERLFRFAALFARLPQHVTLSYCAWQATEARTLGPSAVLLQALRLSRRAPELTFEDLREHTAHVVSAVPPHGRPPLDSDDAWMAAIGRDAVLRRGTELVRAAYPRLDAGLATRQERRTGSPGPVHGVVDARADELDPRRNTSIVLSASRLEALGQCPLRYLHASVLRMYPPDDPELDPDQWLDHRERGVLLHEVYDGILRSALESAIQPEETAFEVLALGRLEDVLREVRDRVPSPGEGTVAREEEALREDVRSFVRMIRDLRPQSDAFELTFGIGDADPVPLPVREGTVRLRGAIDRVDRDLAGLHVVDYKTGSPYAYGPEPFKGGRRLQHALYAHVAEQLRGVEVVDGQYHFPTRKGKNQLFAYPRETLVGVGEIVGLLLDGVAAGHFVPTDDPDDCRFCDYRAVCRVRDLGYGRIGSPMAEWSAENANTGMSPAFVQLKAVRRFE